MSLINKANEYADEALRQMNKEDSLKPEKQKYKNDKFNVHAKRSRKFYVTVIFWLLGIIAVAAGILNKNTAIHQAIYGNEAKTVKVNSRLEINILDVGDSDAVLIENRGEYMLIDSGSPATVKKVIDFLKGKNITSLKYYVITNQDEDHLGATKELLSNFQIGEIFYPHADVSRQVDEGTNQIDLDAYIDIINTLLICDNLTQPMQKKSGFSYSLGEATFSFLYTGKDYGNDPDANSLGLILEFGSKRFLFYGDSTVAVEANLIAGSTDLDIDFLMVSSHGKDVATADGFLYVTSPEYAVISSESEPDSAVLKRLASKNVTVHQTREEGNITVICDGTDISF